MFFFASGHMAGVPMMHGGPLSHPIAFSNGPIYTSITPSIVRKMFVLFSAVTLSIVLTIAIKDRNWSHTPRRV